MSTTLSLATLLVLVILVACGGGDDGHGGHGGPTKGTPDIDSGKAIAAQPAPRDEFKQYRGYYRRLGGDSRFQPCGTSTPLEITGTGMARYLLHERFRWMSVEQGRKMYGVFQGTIHQRPADSAGGPQGATFFITDVDTLRSWKDSDCGGMRIR